MSQIDSSLETIWSGLSHHWDHVDSPLRPCDEDVDFMRTALSSLRSEVSDPLRAMLLGVTPELATLMTEFETIEVDHSYEMIRWSHHKHPRGSSARPAVARWTDLPFAPHSFDCVAGDGCNIQLSFPDECLRWLKEIRRVLKSDGIFVTRIFVSPDVRESPRTVISDIKAGLAANPNAARMRLFAALQQSARTGIRVGEMWSYFRAAGLTDDHLRSIGWSAETIKVFDQFRNKRQRLSFPTFEQFCNAACDWFDVEKVCTPTYELGTRCPTIVLRAKRIHSRHS